MVTNRRSYFDSSVTGIRRNRRVSLAALG